MGLVAFDASRRFGTGGIGDEDLRTFVARWLVCLLDGAIGAEVRRIVPPELRPPSPPPPSLTPAGIAAIGSR